MYNEPIDEVYFNWLYSKVAATKNPEPHLTYYTLMRDLHATDFVCLVQGDDNRAEDGLDLRRSFFREAMLDREENWMHIPCSVLEMLIAFSYRVYPDAEFKTPREWFWVFLDNLGFAELTDARDRVTEKVVETLGHFNWRTYNFSGAGGGLFPLRWPEHDQSKLEIWYQFCAYLVDQERQQ